MAGDLLSLTLGGWILLAWTAAVLAYRLYLSPLARIPGPKLAAATGLYELYYDCICHGKYYREIQRMHQEYGSLTRPSCRIPVRSVQESESLNQNVT